MMDLTLTNVIRAFIARMLLDAVVISIDFNPRRLPDFLSVIVVVVGTFRFAVVEQLAVLG